MVFSDRQLNSDPLVHYSPLFRFTPPPPRPASSFNPKTESCVRGWQLLGLTCETFIPSPTLLPYLLYFISEHIQSDIGGEVPLRRQYAKYEYIPACLFFVLFFFVFSHCFNMCFAQIILSDPLA